MTELTQVQELERKILLQQQAIQEYQAFGTLFQIETCRDRIRNHRRRLWEINGNGSTPIKAI